MLLWTDSCGFRSWPLNSHAHWYRLSWWELHFLLDFVSEITLWHHSFLLSLKGINETWCQKFICKIAFYYILWSENIFLHSCNKRRGRKKNCSLVLKIKHIVWSPDWREVNIFREVLMSYKRAILKWKLYQCLYSATGSHASGCLSRGCSTYQETRNHWKAYSILRNGSYLGNETRCSEFRCLASKQDV